MVIDEMNVDAVQWFQKMKLGQIGVSCNVHDKLREEYRDGVESVLMTDHRLMCDIAGKELLYVQTDADTTQVLRPQDLKFLLMLLWGHLVIERLDLDGVEFLDPREAGAAPDLWGPAGKRSQKEYVEEYQQAKADRAGILGSVKSRYDGLVARLTGKGGD